MVTCDGSAKLTQELDVLSICACDADKDCITPVILEGRLSWKTTIPARDVSQGEAHILEVQLQVRPPGLEEWLPIPARLGGVIKSRQSQREQIVYITRWQRDAIAQFSNNGKTPLPNTDGDFDFKAIGIDENGFPSKESNIVTLRLNLNPPNAPVIEVGAVDGTIKG